MDYDRPRLCPILWPSLAPSPRLTARGFPSSRQSVDQLVPAALTAGLFAAQRFGVFTLLPLNIVIEREYAGYAILLGAVGAVVAAAAFTRLGSAFGIGAFALTVGAGLLASAPFVLGRAGITLGLSPPAFTIAAIFAYLALAGIVGVLIGGCWSLVVTTIRESRTWE